MIFKGQLPHMSRGYRTFQADWDHLHTQQHTELHTELRFISGGRIRPVIMAMAYGACLQMAAWGSLTMKAQSQAL